MEQDKPKPRTFPTDGPRGMRYIAYDDNLIDICAEAFCKCRKAKNNTMAYGDTPSEARANFWREWNERT